MAEGQSQQYHHQLVFQQQQQQHQQQPPQRPRLVRSTPGEIVEVQGGHIVRSTGRKDRHSKVCTAKGPRDRRVRLSANTAIQFYDVQDRLGYDRPSKAVDWLIKNAKSAIDELAELPAWHPTATSNPPLSATSNAQQEAIQRESQPGKKPMSVAEPSGSCHNYGFIGVSSSFLPPSLDSDAIADTIKSFFPMAAATSAAAPSPSQPLGYQNYPPDLLSRSSGHNQDLRLSLQSFQDPIYHHQQHHHNNPTPAGNHAMFAGYNAAGASMPQWNVAEMSGGGGGSDGGGGGGFMFNVLPPQTPQALPLHPMLGQGQFFTQRGPLQSSTPPFVRSWVDPMAAADNPMHPMFHPSVQSIGFAPGSSSSGFSGFRIPARIQGEEEQDGISNKPSSASSGSHH